MLTHMRAAALFLMAVMGAPVGAADFSGRVSFGDADTLKVGAVTVRLFGIDAPEAAQNCTRADGRPWACGKWAARQAKRAFDRKMAQCLFRDRDRYGRVVATCFVGQVDIADHLVRRGIAQAYAKYSTDYIAAEKQAAFEGVGIWAGGMQSPSDFRAAQTEARAAANNIAPSDCVIKGNISKSGRIFHVPGQAFYDETRISPTRGERWFCTRAEAQAAGWRAARR